MTWVYFNTNTPFPYLLLPFPLSVYEVDSGPPSTDTTAPLDDDDSGFNEGSTTGRSRDSISDDPDSSIQSMLNSAFLSPSTDTPADTPDVVKVRRFQRRLEMATNDWKSRDMNCAESEVDNGLRSSAGNCEKTSDCVSDGKDDSILSSCLGSYSDPQHWNLDTLQTVNTRLERFFSLVIINID